MYAYIVLYNTQDEALIYNLLCTWVYYVYSYVLHLFAETV